MTETPEAHQSPNATSRTAAAKNPPCALKGSSKSWQTQCRTAFNEAGKRSRDTHPKTKKSSSQNRWRLGVSRHCRNSIGKLTVPKITKWQVKPKCQRIYAADTIRDGQTVIAPRKI
jgi:hypothetical protein